MIQFYSVANMHARASACTHTYARAQRRALFSYTRAEENRAPRARIFSCGNRSFPTFSEFLSFASDYPIPRYTGIRFIVAELDDAPSPASGVSR